MNAEQVSPTVLLIDESHDEVGSTRSWLQTRGFNVRSAASVGDALDEASDFTGAARPSAIVFDIPLSAHDCECIADYFQEFSDLQNIPVVALNADTDDLPDDKNDFFVQIENLEMLAPLVSRNAAIAAAAKKAAAAAAI